MKNNALSLLTLLLGVSHAGAALTAGDLIITEWMANPAALADSEGEYFEVYNASGATIDLSTAGITILDDGTDTIALGGTGTIAAGDYFVFGNSAQSYVDYNYGADTGNFFLGNSGDEIVILSMGVEVARVNYGNGDPFGSGQSVSLNDLSNHVNGVTQDSDYIQETVDTLPTADIGSPGVAGVTVPEPSISLLSGLALFFLLRRRKS